MRTAALAVCLLVASCGDGAAPLLCDGGACGSQSSWRKNYSWSLNRNVDILFVVDNTSAIAPHGGALATGFADMAQALQDLPQGPPSLHVGVVGAGSCPPGNRGLACGLAAPEQYLRSEWCATTTNFPGAFSDAFTCLADIGAADCAPAQPLSAAVQALTGPARAGWEGFLRPDAYLMIVVIAAEDDASGSPGAQTPVAGLAAAIRGLKADPSQILVSAIVPASCPAGGAPGARLIEFVQSFGANGLLVDLCGGDLAAALMRLGDNIATSNEPWCALNVRDTDLATAGLQASCTVDDHVVGADGSLTRSWLPACDTASPPCWRLVPVGPVCPGGGFFAIDRGPAWCDEASTYGTVECLTCADPLDPACQPATAR